MSEEQKAESNAELLQSLRERRLATMALADQVGAERWREPALPGGMTSHAMISHLLAWDEWASAVFELSVVRELPVKLRGALQEVDAFNARAMARFDGLDRDVLLMGLQNSCARVLAAAAGAGGDGWAGRRIPDLAPHPTRADGKPSRGPSVAGLLRTLREHEREHCEALSAAFGVTVDLDELRARTLGQDAANDAELED